VNPGQISRRRFPIALRFKPCHEALDISGVREKVKNDRLVSLRGQWSNVHVDSAKVVRNLWISFDFRLTSPPLALPSNHLFGLFSVPAPLFDLLAGSSAGFFPALFFSFIPPSLLGTHRRVEEDESVPPFLISRCLT
jgi:hypothetical protein